MRSRVGTARRRGMFDSKSMWLSSHANASASPSKGSVTGTSTGTGSGFGQDAARRERVDLTGAPPRGTNVGATRSSTTERSTTHLPTSSRLGRSYITSSRTSSRMARSPRGTGTPQQRLLGNRLERVRCELELHVVEREHPLVLPSQRVLRLDEDLHQRVLEERGDGTDDRQPPDELGNEAELDEVLGEHVAKDLAIVPVLAVHLGAEADAALADAGLDHLVEPGERAAADEQDVGRVDLDELLVRDACDHPGVARRRWSLPGSSAAPAARPRPTRHG